MGMLNRITIVGRVVADPEIRTTTTGKTVCPFNIANQRNAKVNGEYKTDFYKCVAWGMCGEYIVRNFRKGDLIVIDGCIQTNEYPAKNGEKKKDTEIVVGSAYSVGKRGNIANDAVSELEETNEELPF